MSEHFQHRTIHPALLLVFGAFAWFAESASDNLVFKRLFDFALDREEKDYSASNWQFWFSFGFTALSSLPYILTILYHWKYSHNHEHHHHHSLSHEAREIIVVGGSFGALGISGALLFLETVNPSDELSLQITNYVLSGLAGAAIGWGSYKFHSNHLHAEENFLTLLKKLPTSRKFIGFLLGISVLVGHLFQGGLDAAEFTDVIDKNAPIYGKVVPIIILAILVTLFEGNSEMRSAMLLLNNDQEYKDMLLLTRILLFFSALLHAALPVEGLIKIISIAYKLWTGHSLAHTLDFYWRIALIAASGICLGIGNGYTFYAMNLSIFNIVVKAGLESVRTCWANFFTKPTLNQEEKESLLNVNAGTHDHSLQPVV